MASLEQTAHGSDSITLRLTALSSSSTYSSLKITLGGTTKTVTKTSTTSTVSGTTTFTGLSANTKYTATFSITSSGGSTGSGSGAFYTKPNQVTSVSVGSITTSGGSASWSLSGTASDYKVVVRQGSTSSGSLISTYYPTAKSQSISGLSSNTTYYVGVVARNSQGNEGLSGSTTFTTKAVAPSSPTVSSVSSTKNSVTFSWGSVSGATGYTVKLMNSSGGQISTASTTSTSYTFSSLSGGTYYQVAVLATNSGGSSSYSSSRSIETRPSDMGSVGATTTSTSFTGSWSNGTASSFRVVLRRGSSSSGTLVQETTTYSSSYTFYGLSPSTQYYFGVEPFNSSGVSGISGSITAYTKAEPPSTPTVSSASSTRDSVTFSWTGVSGATGYTVKLMNNSGTQISTTTTTSTSHTFTGLSSGTYYKVAVLATNSAGSSSYSTSYTRETKPADMGAIGISSTTNTMSGSWSNSTASSFRVVLRKGNTSSGELVKQDTTTSNSYTFTGLLENTLYYFGVEPLNVTGEGGISGNNTAYTKVSPPTTMTTSAFTDTSITVAFTGGASSGYTLRVYYSSTGALFKTVTGTTSPLSVTGLNEFVGYKLELTNKNASGVESTAKTLTQTTKDVTAPTVEITKAMSEGVMKIEWTASDKGSGLRKTSTYAVAITSRGGTTYAHKDYTTNNYYSFIDDANGNEFVDGGTYYMRVTAYDEHNNNTSTTSGVVTYKRSRPTNWNWQVAKVKGQKVEVTAQEWNSLCTRINQFRQYKKFDNYTFTEVKRGGLITATIFNEARTALSQITSNSSLPSFVSKGTTITAQHFNGLTTAMNSIS